MTEADERWMAYIDAEVRAVCRQRGWRHQIRCKWSQREQPVHERRIDDYEWKLIPTGDVQNVEAAPQQFDEGVYYVLSFDSHDPAFFLQHDTHHAGILGPHWEIAHYTKISVGRLEVGIPPRGWLERHLVSLTSRFDPNEFSLT